jgi:branched-chain amino acid transport system substrate-binding protein
MKHKNKIIGVVAIIILIAVVSVVKNQETQASDIKLGLMLPLTGDYAAAGQNMQKGMELAIEQYQKNNPGVTIQVATEDDAYDSAKGVSAYKKLVDLDKVDTILMLSTPVIDAIHQDVVKRGIPVIQLGVQTVGVADDNIIQFSPAAEAPIGYLATSLNADPEFSGKKVAVIYDNAAAQISFFETFDAKYEHEFTKMIVNNKSDLRGYATKIANENYDAVVVIQSPENGALFTKELLTLDTTVPLLAYDAQLQTGFGDYEKILGDVNKINGAKSMWFKEGNTAEFKRLYKEKYNEEPGFLADFAYDMVNTALETYEGTDSDWVKNLKKFSDSNGASGSISFDDKGVRIQPMVITEIKDGKLVPTE